MDVFSLYNKACLCIVDYHSMFPVIKKAEVLSAYNQVLACKVIFVNYGLSKKIMSDEGGNFVSEKI